MAKQSAVQHWTKKAGGVLIAHHGWQTAARYPSGQATQTAGLVDVSWMAKFDLKGRGVETLPALGEGVRSWSLGPRHVLVTCSPGKPIETVTPGVFVTDVTSVFSQFVLSGPSAREILAKLSSLNVSGRALPDGGCAQTSLAHVHATILRQDLPAVQAFHVVVTRDYGEFVWEAILHAGREFHLAPLGMEAFAALGALGG